MSRNKQPARGELAGGGKSGAGMASFHSDSTSTEAARQYPRYGQLVGCVWQKTARTPEHKLHSPPGWGLDVDDFEAVEVQGGRFICIRYLVDMNSYWTLLSTVKRYGFIMDRRCGRQRVLPDKWWRATRAEAEQLEQAADRAPREPAPVQLSLFGGGR